MSFSVPTTREQMRAINDKKGNLKCRANVFPVLKVVPTPVKIAIRSEKILNDDGTKSEKIHYDNLDLQTGQVLMGVIAHGNVEFKNMNAESLTVEYKEADGTVKQKVVPAGESTTAFFEGNCAMGYIPADGDKPAMVHIGFDRLVLSNFCRLYAIPMPVAGSETGIDFLSVEAAFQIIKALLTRNQEILDGALDQKKPGDLKTFMGKAVGIPKSWFEATDGECPWSQLAMEYLQAWAATCPVRHSAIVNLINTAKGLGATIDNIFIHEHNQDGTYGTSCFPSDVRPLFDRDFAPKGDIMGKAVTAVARKIDELGTHEAYVAYFKANYAPIFKVEEEEEDISTTTLGARLASEVDLAPPEGRTGSNSRTLSA